MLKIFKYLKQEWLSVLIIFGLLILQATCDLALPQYTSNIVDIGISKYGIENAVPDTITAETFNSIKLFLTEDQINTLDKFYVESNEYNVAAYKLNTQKEADITTLNDIIQTPMVAVYMIGSSDQYSIAQVANMPFEARTQIITGVTEKISVMGNTAIDTATAKVIISEKEKLGIDINKQQNSYMLTTGAKMLGVAMAAMVCTIIVCLLASRAAARIGMNLRLNVFRSVVGFSNTEMDQYSTASLITRSTNDIQQVQMVIVLLLRMVFYAPILGIGGVIKVIHTESSMAWIIATAVGVIMLMIVVLLTVAMPKFKLVQVLVDKVNLVAREILTGLPVIRAFSREKHEEKRFDVANKELTKTQLFTNRVMTFMMPIMMFVMNGVAVMIIWFGGKGIDAGTLQVGDMMAFITYSMQIIISFLMITMVSIMLPRAGVAAGRIDEVMNTKGTIFDPINPKKSEGKGIVQFNDVSFTYPKAADCVIEHIDFTAKPGETTAIIGSTGSGKSTLINLIPRLYDVTSGSLTIDGIDVRDMTQHDLREMIGYVPQKAVLFSGTIESNLKFGNESATAEEVSNAARIAQAQDFINDKEDKYESSISQGGTNVSGGQNQRLSIARAIAKKPKIFIFDDSFSALDYRTDIALRQALKENTGDATVIIVAQRISTILHADQIIVIDEGKIAGVGTHKELLINNEVYRQIAMSQLSEDDITAIADEQKNFESKEV